MNDDNPIKKKLKELLGHECHTAFDERDYYVEMADKCLNEGKSEDVCADLFNDILTDLRNNKSPKDIQTLIDYVGDAGLVVNAVKQHLDLDILRGGLGEAYNNVFNILEEYIPKA